MGESLWDAPEEEGGDWWEDPNQSSSFTEHVYTPHGGCLRGFLTQQPAVLVHGPAGTGKSLMWGNRMYQDAVRYPGSRQLILRKTRVSLTESFLTTWEEKVLWPNHEIMRGAKKGNRQAYNFPNGSVIVIAGMDIPTRIYSSEYDRVYVNEANELTYEEWWSLQRCLRNDVMPFQQLCGDTNPDDESHFLYADMVKGKLYGIQSRHEDNPVITDEYLARLRNLEGVLRDRLYLGLWVAAEGLAFPQYDRETHLVDRYVEPHRVGRDGFYRDDDGSLSFVGYFAGMDFGWSAPGYVGVWGVDRDRRCFLIHEVYSSDKDLDWWAEWLVVFHERYQLRRVVADSAEPRSIEHMNRVLGVQGGRKGLGALVVAAKKDARAQKDLLRWGLKSDVDGHARVFICRDTMVDGVGFCGERDEPGTVQGLAQELPTLRLRQPTPANPNPDDYDPGCRDHAADGTTYALSGHFAREYGQAKKRELFKPGTLGHRFEHDRILGMPRLPTPASLARPGLRR